MPSFTYHHVRSWMDCADCLRFFAMYGRIIIANVDRLIVDHMGSAHLSVRLSPITY